jgi:hypothetical protein
MQTQHQLPKNAKVIEKLQKTNSKQKSLPKFDKISIGLGNEGLHISSLPHFKIAKAN